MRTFLLTWNPRSRGYPEDLYDADIRHFERGGAPTQGTWSVGNRKQGVEIGDRGYLIRQQSLRGVVGSGRFASTVFQDRHWERTGQRANYADIEWDMVVGLDDRLPIEALRKQIRSVNWDRLQASGVVVADEDGAKLGELWRNHCTALGVGGQVSAEEVAPGRYREGGAVSRVLVNRYERDPAARAACLRKWGHDCVVCGFSFPDVYGKVGVDFIHVHHLRELSTVGANYQLKPARDLRPVCPNCHAMLHRRRPAYSIDELRKQLQRRRR